jgi:hypothetical protein
MNLHREMFVPSCSQHEIISKRRAFLSGGSSVVSVKILLSLGTLSTVIDQSGYAFPLLSLSLLEALIVVTTGAIDYGIFGFGCFCEPLGRSTIIPSLPCMVSYFFIESIFIRENSYFICET